MVIYLFTLNNANFDLIPELLRDRTLEVIYIILYSYLFILTNVNFYFVSELLRNRSYLYFIVIYLY